MLVRPGTVELLEQALRLGAETVGGLDPCAIDRDPKGHLDTVFGLAEKFGRGVDIHLHEPGEMGAFSMELIIERTVALGMQGKVIVSHAFCLGMPDAAVVDPLIAALAEARIAIMTTASASRPVPPLKRLCRPGWWCAPDRTASTTPGDRTATRTCWSGRCSWASATICGGTMSWRWRSMWSPQGVRGRWDWKATGWLQGAAAIWCWLRPRLSPRRLHSGRDGARW